MRMAYENAGYNLRPEEIRSIMKSITPNQTNLEDYVVYYQDFIIASLNPAVYKTNNNLLTLFKYYDTSDSGII